MASITISNVTSTSAKVTVTADSSTTRLWTLYLNDSFYDQQSKNSGSYSWTLTGLSPGTTYKVQGRYGKTGTEYPSTASSTTDYFTTLSSYVISDILSEYNVVLFGSYIDLYFNQADWNFGSFMALIMLLLIFLSVFITRKFGKEEDGGRSSLW